MHRRVIALLIAVLALNFLSFAQGNLLITPTRVVFEGTKQREELNLVNIGNDTAVYSISFLQYDMREDGSFITLEESDSGHMFADPYLRIFPRTVTLAPREPQVIMLQCRRKPDMKTGEYRSHLYFRAEKNPEPLGLQNASSDTSSLKVQLIPIFGLSIPIIIRSGEVSVSSSLSDLKLETKPDSMQFLNLSINRNGNISVYGDLSVQFIPQHGKPYEIGSVKGIGVYTNIHKRSTSIKLNSPTAELLESGKIKVQYSSGSETKHIVYGEAELDVP